MAAPLIGVFAGLVGVVTFRRRTPIVIELAVWIGLIGACVLAITGIRSPQAKEMTSATLWAFSQMVSTIAGLLRQDVLRWMHDARFAIADCVAVLFGVDLLILALVSTRRQADSWMPVTKLGEWMVLPSLHATQPKLAPVFALDEINQRFWSAAGLAQLRPEVADIKAPAEAGTIPPKPRSLTDKRASEKRHRRRRLAS